MRSVSREGARRRSTTFDRRASQQGILVTITMTPEAAAQSAPADEETSRYAKWAIAIFFVTLFIPGSFYVGIRMTPYRLYLIAMAIPMILRFRADPTLRVTSVDVLMFLAILWRSLSILVNHQASEIANAGSSFLEVFFGYMLGRVFIRTAADYRFFFKCFLLTLVAFLPFAFLELTTRQRVLKQIWGLVLVNPPTSMADQIRYGLMRVAVSFDHAIQFGYFCAIGFVNMYYVFYNDFLKKYALMGFTAAMGLMSLSSGPFLVLFLQACMIGYDRIFQFLRFKWILLGALIVASWFSFQLIFGVTVPEYIANELVYNEHGGNARLEQVQFGLREVYRSPIFGIGLETYAHPFWRSPSIDNFYLFLGIRSGVPAVLLFLAAIVMLFLKAGFATYRTEEKALYRNGYLIGLFCLLLALYVTYIWGIGNVFFMLYVGAGAWFFNGADARTAPRRLAPAVPARRIPRPGPAGGPGWAVRPPRPSSPRVARERLSPDAGRRPPEDRAPRP